MTSPTLSDLQPSARLAFKSRYYVERRGWSATLKVDYDEPLCDTQVQEIGAMLLKLTDGRSFSNLLHCACRIAKVQIHATRKGHHLRVWLKHEAHETRVPPEILRAVDVLYMQGALGDDIKRREFNAARVARGEPCWNLLFNEKWINGHLVMREEFDDFLTEVLTKAIRR